MNPAIKRPLVVPAVSRHTATIIMAHGLGDSGAGWIDLAENWRRREKFNEVKFVFPNAPTIPITANGGYPMPGWYDILGFGNLNGRDQDEAGILRSRAYFNSLVDEEIDAGIPSNRIVIGGFSQGGAMAILTGATSHQPLGGIFGLSCYLLLQDKIKGLAPENPQNKDTEIFMGHGTSDPLVKPEWGLLTANALKEMGHKVQLKMYPGLEHSAIPQEIDDLEAYLHTRIPDLDKKATPKAASGFPKEDR